MLCMLGVCVLAAQITSGGLYHEETPTEVTYDRYVDNTYAVYETHTQDISGMYEPKNIQFRVRGYVILDTDTRIDLSYDNGLRSEKHLREKSLTVGITQLKVIDEDTRITFGISTRIGGSRSNMYCLDDANIRRVCDTSGLWSLRSKPDNTVDVKTVFTFNHKFNWFLGTKETINKE